MQRLRQQPRRPEGPKGSRQPKADGAHRQAPVQPTRPPGPGARALWVAPHRAKPVVQAIPPATLAGGTPEGGSQTGEIPTGRRPSSELGGPSRRSPVWGAKPPSLPCGVGAFPSPDPQQRSCSGRDGDPPGSPLDA
jgi:hypothetical protein